MVQNNKIVQTVIAEVMWLVSKSKRAWGSCLDDVL